MLLLEANRHSPGPERDLSREVHKAEWRLKEQKLKDDIRGLREKLTGLVCEPAGGLGVGGALAVATGSRLEPSHKEGSKCPRSTGEVSDVAGGGAAGGPFVDIVAGHAVGRLTQGRGRLPKTLSLSRARIDYCRVSSPSREGIKPETSPLLGVLQRGLTHQSEEGHGSIKAPSDPSGRARSVPG